jgi:3',5'-cyclic AMP phosphodiesterase CpdA
MRKLVLMSILVAAALVTGIAAAQEPRSVLTIVAVRPIQPPDTPLPPEPASAGVRRFSFIAYGDTRCDCRVDETDALTLLPARSEAQPDHALVVDSMAARIAALASSPYPVRLVVQSGDAVFRGPDGGRWNDVFTPIIEKLTRGAGVPFFFAAGNHDVTGTPAGDPHHSLGLHNTLSAISRLIPSEGSPRRLNGYATYAFGYGNAFFIVLDSNIPSDAVQLAWTSDQLDHLDRVRYQHVIVVLHHPPFTSGRYSGVSTASLLPGAQPAAGGLSSQALVLRNLYLPLFRKHHVRMIISGHDHLYDHWVEWYLDKGVTFRMDDIVSGGGGAPTYVYTGEPDLREYLAAGAVQQVRVEHLMKPGAAVVDNPHHFVIVQVDGDRLTLEVVGVGVTHYGPYNGRARIELTDRKS